MYDWEKDLNKLEKDIDKLQEKVAYLLGYIEALIYTTKLKLQIKEVIDNERQNQHTTD